MLDKISKNLVWYPDGTRITGNRKCRGYFILRRVLMGLLSIIDDDGFLLVDDNSSSKHPLYYTIAPRKAHPFFAAVPVKDNISCYGPWTNYPWLSDNRVYPGYTPNAKFIKIEQLMNNTDVQKDSNWAPWNYGGMSFLDQEILNQIDFKTSYQTQLERGTLVTAGMPIFNMSAGLNIRTIDSDVYSIYNSYFMNYNYLSIQTLNITNYAGLVLQGVSTSVSDRDISTTYQFDTYSAKLGMFSKEITDRNKLSSKIRIEVAAEMGKVVKEINKKITSTYFSVLKENSMPRDNKPGAGSNFRPIGKQTSPTEFLVGSASFYVSCDGLPYCGDPGLNSKEFQKLRNDTTPLGESKFIHTITRTKNWVAAYEAAQGLSELASQYNTKSLMSFDGIFSPVSFYPTYDLGTYPVSSRFLSEDDKKRNITCPMCMGTSIYQHYRGEEKTLVNYPCPMCNCRTKLIVPTGAPNSSGTTQDNNDPPLINFKSLNPIIMPSGEFQNPNSQVGVHPFERSRHNIRIIGRQERPIEGDMSLDTNQNLAHLTYPNGGTSLDATEAGVEINAISGHNADYHTYDLSYFAPQKILLNQRFFAFRGPMMLHGWGYDTEGYPVPNKADEPAEFDSVGRPKRFVLTSSGTNDFTKDGKFLPNSGEFLGDIIGAGYVKENGQWTRKPSKYFHLNWGERNDLWPIGPIDLRWDRERKVWTGGEGGCGEINPPYIIASGSEVSILNNFISKSKGEASANKKCPYKMVYIVLEENLISDLGKTESYPARGFLDDAEYSLEPLPKKTRRLAYVKDRCGYSAPRGAKLLCRYNRETGFYEPVTKPNFIVFGTIAGGANTAVVELSYIRGIKAGESVPKTNITFDNTRFNFNINASKSRRGMFLFENGKWILTGFN